MSTIRSVVTKVITRYQPLYPMLRYCNRQLKKRENAVDIVPVSEENKRKIKELWGKYSRWFDYYNTIGDRSRTYLYFPNPWYFKYVETKLNNWKICESIDDKCLYDFLFYDVPRPKTVVKICNGMYLDAQSRPISLSEAVAACRAVGNVIIKPSVSSSGGQGILFWNEDSGIDIESVLRDSKNDIVQELIGQHPTLSQIHSDSINTIRIMTMTTDEGVKHISSLLRVGVGDAKVDNFSRGGLVFGIDSEGKLKEKGFSNLGICFDKHPNGTKTAGIPVPSYFNCIDICKATAPRFARFSRMISWDFAIQTDGTPMLIEANLNHGGISSHQICNGPIFGDEETTRQMIKKYVKFR